MKRFLLALVVVALAGSVSDARWPSRFSARRTVAAARPSASCPDVASAQHKAEIMASQSLSGHIGRTQIPAGCSSGYEGTAGHRSTRDDAIRSCCYWGQKTPVEIGAAQNAAGQWFAVVYYR